MTSLYKFYESSKLEAQENYYSYLRTAKYVQDDNLPAWYFEPSEEIGSILTYAIQEIDSEELESNKEIVNLITTGMVGYSITIGKKYISSNKFSNTLDTDKLYRLFIVALRSVGGKKNFYGEIFKKLE